MFLISNLFYTRIYQQIDNFDDNAFAWFQSFQKSRPGDALFDQGLSRSLSLIEEFAKDLAADTLPQVSWIIAPSWRSEHASHHPSVGEAFTARILKKLENHPKVYAKSAFILNYDEGGQFYDHSWAPTPPMSEKDGVSTVTTQVQFELSNFV
jgi:phospholipase C